MISKKRISKFIFLFILLTSMPIFGAEILFGVCDPLLRVNTGLIRQGAWWVRTSFVDKNIQTLNSLKADLDRMLTWSTSGVFPYNNNGVKGEIVRLRSEAIAMQRRGFSEPNFLPLVSRYIELVDLRQPHIGSVLSRSQEQRLRDFLSRSTPTTLAKEVDRTWAKISGILSNRQKSQIIYHWGGTSASMRQILDAVSILKPLIAIKSDPPFDYDGFSIDSLIEMSWHDLIHYEKIISVLGDRGGSNFADYDVNILLASVTILRKLLQEIDLVASAEEREILTLVLFDILHEQDLNVLPHPYDPRRPTTYFGSENLLSSMPQTIGDKIKSGKYGPRTQAKFAGREHEMSRQAVLFLKKIAER